MSCDDRWTAPPFFNPQAPGGNASSKHYGLGIHGLGQKLCRAISDHLPQIITQCRRRLVKGCANHRSVAVRGHHANGL
jgi:hypothetical protein